MYIIFTRNNNIPVVHKGNWFVFVIRIYILDVKRILYNGNSLFFAYVVK